MKGKGNEKDAGRQKTEVGRGKIKDGSIIVTVGYWLFRLF